jgi:hypothetical protein
MATGNTPPEVRVSNWTLATGTRAGDRRVIIWGSDLTVGLSDHRFSNPAAGAGDFDSKSPPGKTYFETMLAHCLPFSVNDDGREELACESP